MNADLPVLCRQLRRDILEMTHAAGSGHPGGSLSAVEIVATLYFDVMRIWPDRPDDPNRDRFILSKGMRRIQSGLSHILLHQEK